MDSFLIGLVGATAHPSPTSDLHKKGVQLTEHAGEALEMGFQNKLMETLTLGILWGGISSIMASGGGGAIHPLPPRTTRISAAHSGAGAALEMQDPIPGKEG